MRIAIDYDGVISANWNHYTQLIFDLTRNDHEVHIVTASGPYRWADVDESLRKVLPNSNKITIHHRPINMESTLKNIGEWKKSIVKDFDLWFDNEIKNYELAGVDFSDLKTAIVRI